MNDKNPIFVDQLVSGSTYPEILVPMVELTRGDNMQNFGHKTLKNSQKGSFSI